MAMNAPGTPGTKTGRTRFFLGGSLVENPKRKISDKFFPTTKKLAPKNLSDLRNFGIFWASKASTTQMVEMLI